MSASGAIKEISKPQTPTLEGFCSYAGIKIRTFAHYTTSEDLGDVATIIRERILAMKMDSLANGRGSTGGLIFDITNNYKDYRHANRNDQAPVGEVKIIIERERNAGVQSKIEGSPSEPVEGN